VALVRERVLTFGVAVASKRSACIRSPKRGWHIPQTTNAGRDAYRYEVLALLDEMPADVPLVLITGDYTLAAGAKARPHRCRSCETSRTRPDNDRPAALRPRPAGDRPYCRPREETSSSQFVGGADDDLAGVVCLDGLGPEAFHEPEVER
jgi:hypothetical protein